MESLCLIHNLWNRWRILVCSPHRRQKMTNCAFTIQLHPIFWQITSISLNMNCSFLFICSGQHHSIFSANHMDGRSTILFINPSANFRLLATIRLQSVASGRKKHQWVSHWLWSALHVLRMNYRCCIQKFSSHSESGSFSAWVTNKWHKIILFPRFLEKIHFNIPGSWYDGNLGHVDNRNLVNFWWNQCRFIHFEIWIKDINETNDFQWGWEVSERPIFSQLDVEIQNIDIADLDLFIARYMYFSNSKTGKKVWKWELNDPLMIGMGWWACLQAKIYDRPTYCVAWNGQE
jgi:hypothetical protein